MLKVTAQALELRGIANATTKKGNNYFTIQAETPDDGTAFSFYCPEVSALPEGLRKGMMVDITFNVKYFQGKERLEVCAVKPSPKTA